MSTLNRYDIYEREGDWALEKHKEGDFVYFDDANEVITKLQAELAKLEKQIDELLKVKQND